MEDQPVQPDFQQQIDEFVGDYEAIVAQLGKRIVGLERVIDEVLICLLSGGHALLEGVPGLGKTLLVRSLAEVLEMQFSRIQFTPDLMPADITGTNIVVTSDTGQKEFRFQSGPIFANLILADEINRATPKTQSAVLEAMEERTVSVARTTHQLPRPFFVLATQNPLEMEGTYPLPEAQLDRFMLKINVESPRLDEMVEILDRTTGTQTAQLEHAATAERILQMRQVVRQVVAASHVKEYVGRLVLSTHPDSPHAAGIAKQYVRYGASPRGAQAILLAGRVMALRNGRASVAFSDVRQAAAAALRHRLILTFEAQADGITPDQIIQQILEEAQPPTQ